MFDQHPDGLCLVGREVKDAIPVPLDGLRGVMTAVRGSVGANAPQSLEVRCSYILYPHHET